LLGTLFGKRTALVLEALTFTREPVHLSELARRADSAPITASRILAGLVKANMVIREKKGNLVLYSFSDARSAKILRELVEQTRGVVPALRESLRKIRGVEEAFVFGSYAAHTEGENSDVDVVIVGSPQWSELAKTINAVEAKFNREVNYVVYSRAEFEKKKKTPFLTRILKEKKIVLVERVEEK
jgi:predicted nucleotidyltransferase